MALLASLAFAPLGARAARRARRPVRVADARRSPGAKTLPAPDPAAVKALLDRIETGKSSLGIDLAYFAVTPGRENEPTAKALVERGESLRKEYLGYMKELAATPIGFKLLSDLDRSKHKTALQFDLKSTDNHTKSAGPNATNKTGEPATIIMNPRYTHFDDNTGRRDLPWMTERQKYGCYHELVHAWRITNGTQATGLGPHGVRNAEWQATGLGPYASEPVSDNALRRAMGKAERPEYNGHPYPAKP
jgi:hypothetical protein